MKRHFFITLTIGMILCSCSTPIKSIKSADYIHISPPTQNMEFIGIKNIRRNHPNFINFGSLLENNNIALDRQDFYAGEFSLQELEAYKPSKRYIAYIDVVKHYFTHNDSIHDRNGLEIAGWIIAGCTGFTLLPVYIPMICAANGNDCLVKLDCEFKIHVYDSVKKEIILSSPVSVNKEDMYRGQYSHKQTDRMALNEYYKRTIQNVLLEHFVKVNNFIKNINE